MSNYAIMDFAILSIVAHQKHEDREMKNITDTSWRKTPWDNSKELTNTQAFIKKKYQSNYDSKHPKLTKTNEALLINSLKVFSCPYCEKSNFKKYGKTKNSVQRYYCNDCLKTFTAITNTVFDNHKISITEWVEFCLSVLNYGSIAIVSKMNKNGINTTIYWLHKLFLILDEYQKDIKLTGETYIDETFYSVIYSERQQKEGKFLRGLSKDKFCIGIGCDKKHTIAILEGMGKPSDKTTKMAFLEHIEKGSTLIHDDEKSHKILVKELGLKDVSYKSRDLKNIKDEDNPLNPINRKCDLLKKFLYSHSGFNRDDLQNYLNLFCFIVNGPRNKLKKVEILLDLALKTKITLKYRDLFEKDCSK